MKNTIAASFLCAGLLAGTPLAAADEAAPTPRADGSWVVHLDVIERQGSREEHFVLELPLVADSCSEAMTTRGAVDTTVRVCDAGGRGGGPVLAFDLDRVERTKTGAAAQHVKSRVRMALDRAATVGRFEHADGAQVTVTATLRAS